MSGIFRISISDLIFKLVFPFLFGIIIWSFLYIAYGIFISINPPYDIDTLFALGMIFILFAITGLFVGYLVFYIKNIKLSLGTYIKIENNQIEFNGYYKYVFGFKEKPTSIKECISLNNVAKISAKNYTILGYDYHRGSKVHLTKGSYFKLDFIDKSNKLITKVDGKYMTFGRGQLKKVFRFLKANYPNIRFDGYKLFGQNIEEDELEKQEFLEMQE